MTLKELRKQKGLTQEKCAEYLNVPLRTYQNYEKNEGHGSEIKIKYMYDKLAQYGYVDEEHGVLTFDAIKKACGKVFDNNKIKYCYLFGSYAKGKATEKSDVDLLVSGGVSGINFYGLIEQLREELNKKVDLICVDQLDVNPKLLNEILEYGIKIYG